MHPLKNIKVVSLEQAVAAPLCSRRLVLAGAEVFKIERPEGDFARYYDTAVAGQSAYFVWLNAGKKSVVLDLSNPTDLKTLRQLINRCDVLIQNLKPGALAKLGVDLAQLHTEQPGLISVSIAGFNPSGPGARRKAYDLLMQAESGLADITGSPHAPGRVGVSVVDLATGMFAYEAILEALLARAQSGIGEMIDVALFDAVAEWMAVPYLLEKYTGAAPARMGLAHPGICPYGVFRSVDDIDFVLSIQNEGEWRRLCEVGLGDQSLLSDPRCVDNETRVAHRTFVDGHLQSSFDSRTYDEIHSALNAADLAFAPVNQVRDLQRHADFHTEDIQVDGKTIALPVVPGRQKTTGHSVPGLGEHTAEVRRWLETQAD
jgi:itaconate CoA-transferase